MLEDFTARTFSGRVGDRFIIHRDAADSLEVELVSVEESSGGSASDGRRPFSVVFRGPSGLPLSQGIRRMEHYGIGVFDLFLVPVGQDGEGFLYEAVFN